MAKLSTFTYMNNDLPVKYIETQNVKNGVECDIYEFIGDSSKDLGVVRVNTGSKTPLQLVMSGNKTVEGYISGTGQLSVTTNDVTKVYVFPNDNLTQVEVGIGQTVQWESTDNLIFYEVCEPAYQDGRFKNLED